MRLAWTRGTAWTTRPVRSTTTAATTATLRTGRQTCGGLFQFRGGLGKRQHVCAFPRNDHNVHARREDPRMKAERLTQDAFDARALDAFSALAGGGDAQTRGLWRALLLERHDEQQMPAQAHASALDALEVPAVQHPQPLGKHQARLGAGLWRCGWSGGGHGAGVIPRQLALAQNGAPRSRPPTRQTDQAKRLPGLDDGCPSRRVGGRRDEAASHSPAGGTGITSGRWWRPASCGPWRGGA